MSTEIDLTQVQSLVLRGYRVLEAHPYQRYVFVRIADAAAGRAWLKALLSRVTTCADFDRQEGPFVLNVALTIGGLKTLGVPEDARWPKALCDGMASRAQILGDVGESAPQHWDQGLGGSEVGAVVSIAGADSASIADGTQHLEDARQPGITDTRVEDAAHLEGKPAGMEHFGFVDGIGQPYVEGSGLRSYDGEGTPTKKGWAAIKPGEFVLGYPSETDAKPKCHPFQRHGSYFALRKLQERVAEFRAYVADIASLYGTTPDMIAAKMVGRWQSGASLVAAPKDDDAKLAADPSRNNDFRYEDDPKGERCPFGAHVRRANPRDDPTGPSIGQVKSHRIIRRALPYGSVLPVGAKDDGADRGVMFGVIGASIENQFEYVQLNWMNADISSRSMSMAQDKDPLVGAHDGTGKLWIPDRKRPRFCWRLPRFVHVRGGEYFFVPGMDALHTLAGGV